jgi:hypothetical protein
MFHLERMNGLSPSRPTVLGAEDILRLPHGEILSKGDMEGLTQTSMSNVSHEIPFLGDGVGIMGCLVYIFEIWAQILTRIQGEAFGFGSTADSTILRKMTERMASISGRHSYGSSLHGEGQHKWHQWVTNHSAFSVPVDQDEAASVWSVGYSRFIAKQKLLFKKYILATDLMYATAVLRGLTHYNQAQRGNALSTVIFYYVRSRGSHQRNDK